MTNDEKKALLCALVDGKQLQVRDKDDPNCLWQEEISPPEEVARELLLEDCDWEWRIAPERVVRYVNVISFSNNSGKSPSDWFGPVRDSLDAAKEAASGCMPTVALTWEDGKLISAEIVE